MLVNFRWRCFPILFRDPFSTSTYFNKVLQINNLELSRIGFSDASGTGFSVFFSAAVIRTTFHSEKSLGNQYLCIPYSIFYSWETFTWFFDHFLFSYVSPWSDLEITVGWCAILHNPTKVMTSISLWILIFCIGARHTCAVDQSPCSYLIFDSPLCSKTTYWKNVNIALEANFITHGCATGDAPLWFSWLVEYATRAIISSFYLLSNRIE